MFDSVWWSWTLGPGHMAFEMDIQREKYLPRQCLSVPHLKALAFSQTGIDTFKESCCYPSMQLKSLTGYLFFILLDLPLPLSTPGSWLTTVRLATGEFSLTN